MKIYPYNNTVMHSSVLIMHYNAPVMHCNALPSGLSWRLLLCGVEDRYNADCCYADSSFVDWLLLCRRSLYRLLLSRLWFIVCFYANYCYTDCCYANYCYADCYYANYCYADCYYANYCYTDCYANYCLIQTVAMLTIVMQTVTMLTIVMQTVTMLTIIKTTSSCTQWYDHGLLQNHYTNPTCTNHIYSTLFWTNE